MASSGNLRLSSFQDNYLTGRSSQELHYTVSSRDPHVRGGRTLTYQLPISISEQKFGNTEKRSLDVSSPIDTRENVHWNSRKPTQSPFARFSSFASFNTIGRPNIQNSQFTCKNRAPGYYADIELDCKVSYQVIL